MVVHFNLQFIIKGMYGMIKHKLQSVLNGRHFSIYIRTIAQMWANMWKEEKRTNDSRITPTLIHLCDSSHHFFILCICYIIGKNTNTRRATALYISCM